MEVELKKTSIFETIIKYALLFNLILILDGFISSFSYYKIFNISVIDYFTFKDYIYASFKSLQYLLPVALAYLTVPFLSNKKIDLYNFFSAPDKKVKFPSIPFGIYNKTLMQSTMMAWLMCMFIFIVLSLLTNDNKYIQFIIFATAIYLASFIYQVLTYLRHIKSIELSTPRLRVITIITFIILIKVAVIVMYGFKDFDSKINNQKMTFNFNKGDKIQTSNTILYLGKSEDYIFLFNKMDKKALIYNRSTIATIENR